MVKTKIRNNALHAGQEVFFVMTVRLK